MQVLLQRVGIETGHRVLDVGFRDTEELRAIAARVGPTGHAAGIDVNPQHVEAARGEFGRLSPGNVTADRGSMLDIPFDDRTFDVIFCKGVLHEVRRIGKALEEMARVCKPGGILCIVDVKRFSRFKFEVYRWTSWLRGRRTGDVHPGFAHDRLQQSLRKVGFEEDHYEELPTTWRLGFNRVKPFFLRARRTLS